MLMKQLKFSLLVSLLLLLSGWIHAATTTINFVPAGSNVTSQGFYFQAYQIRTDNYGKNSLAIEGSSDVYVSEDYAFTWIHTPLPTTASNGYSLYWSGVAVSGNGERFYAVAANTNLLYWSTNPTTSWSTITMSYASFLSSAAYGGYSNSVLSTDYTGQHIFAYGRFQDPDSSSSVTPKTYNQGFSSNYGQTFAPITQIPYPCYSLAVDNSGTNLACVFGYNYYISNNGGQSFTTYTTTVSNYYMAASSYNGNKYLYLIPNSGTTVAISADNGISWTTSTLSSTTLTFTGISTSGNGQFVYIATKTGLYYSTNAGMTWTLTLAKSAPILSASASGSSADAYAGTFASGTYAYRNNSALTAAPSAAPTAAPTVSVVWSTLSLPHAVNGYSNAIAISNNGAYYMVGQNNGFLVSYTAQTQAFALGNVVGYWRDMCMSSDGSAVIAVSDDALYYLSDYSMTTKSATMNLPSGSTFYQCAMNAAGTVALVYSSSDNGLTPAVSVYRNSNGGTFNPVFNKINSFSSSVTNIAVDSTGTTLVITDSNFVYLSRDGGNSWTYAGNSNPANSQGASLFTMSQYYYGANMLSSLESSAGIMCAYSMDQGSSWTSIRLPEIDNFPVFPLSLDASYSGQVAVLGSIDYLYLSTDFGMTWNIVLNKLNQEYYGAVDPSGKYLAVFNGSSVLKIGVNSFNVAPVPSPTMAPTFSPTVPTTGHSSKQQGWVYANYYYDNSNCKGTPDLVSGYRLGKCFQTTLGTSYSYSCSSKTLTTTWYNNLDCTGTPLTSADNTLPTATYTSTNVNTNTPSNCFAYQCTTSSNELPLPSGTLYSVDQYFEDGMDGSCTGEPLRFDAVINNKCIGVMFHEGYYNYYYASFPWEAAGCDAQPYINYTMPSGCSSYLTVSTMGAIAEYTQSNMAVATESARQSLLFHPDGGILSTKDMGKAFSQRFNSRSVAKKEEKVALNAKQQQQRDLGVFYYDDNLDQYQGYSFTRVVGTLSSSSSSSSLSGGAIAGIVIGTLVGVALLAAVVILFMNGYFVAGFASGAAATGPSKANTDMELGKVQTVQNPLNNVKK